MPKPTEIREQLLLLPLQVDARPALERNATDRYREPSLLAAIAAAPPRDTARRTGRYLPPAEFQPNLYYARVSAWGPTTATLQQGARGGRRLFDGPGFETREEAAADAFASCPTAQECSTCRGFHFDIRWHRRGEG
jgi:hypothetical protein